VGARRRRTPLRVAHGDAVSAPLTEARLAEIEVRANAATPGPWTNTGYADFDYARGPHVENSNEGIVAVCSLESQEHKGNGDFIAAARADVPDLVAEVRRLTAALAAHQRLTDAAVDGVRAMLPAALEIARREGAEAMRSTCVALCQGRAGYLDDSGTDDVDRGRFYEARDLAEALAILPLPGDPTPADPTKENDR